MSRLSQLGNTLGLMAISAMAYAGPPVEGAMEKQATNWHAIIMFCIFVALSMGITYWASGRTKSTADFYSAGGASPAGRTAWRLPGTTCRPPHCSV